VLKTRLGKSSHGDPQVIGISVDSRCRLSTPLTCHPQKRKNGALVLRASQLAQLEIDSRRNRLANWGYNSFVKHLGANELRPDRVRRTELLSALLQ